MVECGKCRNWFHEECISETESDIKSILIYFCQCCLSKNRNLKIVYRDYSKENTKPLFNSNDILNVYNLYQYHTLLELYKVLKFRIPYCLYDIVNHSDNQYISRGLSLCIPKTSIAVQKHTFFYKGTILWNKLHKKILTPFTIKIHQSHKLKYDSSSPDLSFYDFSTTCSTFKTRLKGLIFQTQKLGDVNWSCINNVTA